MPPQYRVRIVSDGTPADTKVSIVDGPVLDHVVAATVRLEARELATAEIEILMPVADITALLAGIDFRCVVCGSFVTHRCGED